MVGITGGSYQIWGTRMSSSKKQFFCLFLFLNLFYWSIVDLQCCVNSAISTMTQLYLCTFSFIFFSIMVYHRILNIVPVLYSRTLCLSIPYIILCIHSQIRPKLTMRPPQSPLIYLVISSSLPKFCILFLHFLNIVITVTSRSVESQHLWTLWVCSVWFSLSSHLILAFFLKH